jgi:hypothetical protein
MLLLELQGMKARKRDLLILQCNNKSPFQEVYNLKNYNQVNLTLSTGEKHSFM